MSQKDVELAVDLFERWSERDFDFLFEASHADVEIFSRFASLGGGEPFRGPEGVRQWIAEIEQNFGRFKVRTDEFIDLDDRVLVLGAIDLEGKTSGVGLEQPMGWLLELQDGKLSRMFFYSSHAEAREAAGLTPPGRHGSGR